MTGRHSRIERALAVALLGAIPVLGAALLLPPVLNDYRSTAAEVASLEARESELAARQRDLPALEAFRDRLRQADPTVFGVLVTGTVELARVQIQRQVQEIAAKNGAEVVQARAVRTEEPSTAASAVSLTLPQDALPRLLVDLANAKPLIFVDAIDVRREPAYRSEGDAPRLSMDLQLSSYTLIEKAEAGQ